MERAQVLSALRSHADEFRRLGLSRLFLFGSVARDEATPGSDLDLFFDFADPRFSLIELAGLKQRMADILNAPTDLMSRGSLHPTLRSAIEAGAVQVF